VKVEYFRIKIEEANRFKRARRGVNVGEKWKDRVRSTLGSFYKGNHGKLFPSYKQMIVITLEESTPEHIKESDEYCLTIDFDHQEFASPVAPPLDPKPPLPIESKIDELPPKDSKLNEA
jgi:hypothetical protein